VAPFLLWSGSKIHVPTPATSGPAPHSERDHVSFDRLGRFAVRRRWWIVGAWMLVLLAAIPFAPQAPGALSAGGFISENLESARAKQLLEDELGLPPSALVLLYTSDTLVAGTPDWILAVQAATAEVSTAPHVVSIVSHALAPRQVAEGGQTAYDVVFLDLPPDDSPEAVPLIEERLREVPGLTVRIGGGPAFYGDVQEVSESDLRRAELISLPLAALALLFVFGSVVAAAVPLAVGGAAVVVALAAIFALASVTPMSIFVLNLATLLGLGLAWTTRC
jgi:putative drug exporter of the RND superfamily